MSECWSGVIHDEVQVVVPGFLTLITTYSALPVISRAHCSAGEIALTLAELGLDAAEAVAEGRGLPGSVQQKNRQPNSWVCKDPRQPECACFAK